MTDNLFEESADDFALPGDDARLAEMSGETVEPQLEASEDAGGESQTIDEFAVAEETQRDDPLDAVLLKYGIDPSSASAHELALAKAYSESQGLIGRQGAELAEYRQLLAADVDDDFAEADTTDYPAVVA